MAHHRPLNDTERDDITALVTQFITSSDITPSELARRTGLAQPFIWSVTKGKFLKMTPRLHRLVQYIRIKIDASDPEGAGVQEAIDRYMAKGGDLMVLKSSIEILTSAFGAERRA